MQSNIVRYSDIDLAEFKAIILDKLKTANEVVTQTTDSMSSTNANDGDRNDSTNNDEKELLTRLLSRQLTYVQQLKNALMRIENRTYGICTETKMLIPKERLLSVPHTTLCKEAKDKAA
jgi:DnaK suppressor protein